MSGTGASGRERRRKGLVNLLRRGLYALLLWISAPLNAIAADDAASPADPRLRHATIDLEALPAATEDAAPGWRIGVSTRDPRMALPLSAFAERLRSRRWNFDRTFPSLRGGIGLDIDLPEAGNLHLNLLPRRSNASGQGLRWQLSADESQDRRQLWSLGGTVDRVRSARNGDVAGQTDSSSRLALAPQLILDVDALTGMRGDAQLTVQRAQWRNGRSDGDDQSGQVWQVNLRWRF